MNNNISFIPLNLVRKAVSLLFSTIATLIVTASSSTRDDRDSLNVQGNGLGSHTNAFIHSFIYTIIDRNYMRKFLRFIENFLHSSFSTKIDNESITEE